MKVKHLLSKLRRNPFPNHTLGYASEAAARAIPPSASGPAKSKKWTTTITEISSWPGGATSLKTHTWVSCLYMIGDVVLILSPIYFILLGIAVITLNGTPIRGNSFGPKVESAISLGPTIFPIVFAAINGRSMKMIARYLAEKGARLGTLELLMASQSVWGTFESQLLMQRLTLTGANLFFLWALSPLGGQASLRLMTRDDRQTYGSIKLRYLTTGPGGTVWGLASAYQESGQFADAGALYTAALLAPQSTRIGPRDPWGNVKIPALETLNSSTADPDGWLIVPNATSPETYTSLVGLPIVGLPLDKDSNFTLESTYLSMDCGDFDQYPYPGMNGSTNSVKTNWTRFDEIASGQIWRNKSIDNPFGDVGRRASFLIDSMRGFPWDVTAAEYETLLGRLDGFVGNYNRSRLNKAEEDTRREIIYVSKYARSRDENDFGLNKATCFLSQVHVETLVECGGVRCTALKVRKSLSDTRPSALTGFEHGVIASNFAQEFPKAVNFAMGSSPTEHFLVDSSAFPFVQQVGQPAQDVIYANVSVVAPNLFSRRLSLVLNTYYQLSTQPTGYWGGLSSNLSAYGPDTLPVTDINVYLPSNFSATNHSFFDWWPTFQEEAQKIKSPFVGATTAANVTSTEQVFVCNLAWLSLLLTSSTVILLTGAFALVLKQKTLAPELFGFVSSMTYENPYIKIPEGGSTLDAMERARLLRDVEMFVADVQGEKEVGHIAFAAGVPLRKLERGRLYM